ncbi:uncharacterized protein BDR25DRAFT_242381 [Lindgomyces ingoldianus]|uniref:Uncharacterized protein n=1 Tax=Lindgomyces ingoldianus TaxID=673940 RepID=A0ACB6QE84_9PLEO|nr:uncharacterized protein BDR25DRAFT_242381 [Lindgomyces ingoldianus]KAF2464437.1 hypothetical protein BDR25DRAFT_242381 [Lindgomyces ingoldianus]
MSALPPPPPQWVIDLNSTPASKPKNLSIPDPPGYTAALSSKQRSQSSKTAVRKAPTTEEMDTLKMKKAWELAIAPAKQLPMNAIGTLCANSHLYLGMYMTGNTLQIFSIFMVFTLFKTPVIAVLSLQRVFAPFETPGTSGRLIGVKIVYVLMNMLMLGLGIWKVNQMGLLPTTRSDWLAWEGERTWSERAVPRQWL